MLSRLPSRTRVALCCLAWTVLAPRTALALQPLEEFLRAGRATSPDNLEARSNLKAQTGDSQVAWGAVLPGIEARLGYTRNQYQVAPEFAVDPAAPPVRLLITPFNQWDGAGTLRVPLINLSNYLKVSANRANEAALLSAQQATALQVQSGITAAYFTLVANLALLDASKHALDVARAGFELTRTRLEAGSAAALDADRAAVEVERQVQQVAQAELEVDVAVRQLGSLSGVAPAVGPGASLPDDLSPEEPLAHFERPDQEIPSLHRDAQLSHVARRQALAQKLNLIPSLSGSFVERYNNATGFLGRAFVYAAMLNLEWKFDLGTAGNMRAASARAAAAEARQERARRSVRDTIHRYWQTVRYNIAKSHSARAQQRVSAEAVALAKDRYAAGVATQLELLQAQRDAFAADVTRIGADADLVNSRLQLRLAAGIELDDRAKPKDP